MNVISSFIKYIVFWIAGIDLRKDSCYNMPRRYEKFYHGKGIKKNDTHSKPMTAEPNSFIDSYVKKNGKFASRRKFDSTGRAIVDLDAGHNHRPFDHVHDLITVFDFHKDYRLPTKRERKEFKKAKKKRRFM